MSLTTPERIRTLQRRLYAKAKKEPRYRFYTLYDKIYRWDILEHAYHRARANAGAPGVDGVTFEQIEAAEVEVFLREIQRELQEGTYRADPVRRVEIAKPDGKSVELLNPVDEISRPGHAPDGFGGQRHVRNSSRGYLR